MTTERHDVARTRFVITYTDSRGEHQAITYYKYASVEQALQFLRNKGICNVKVNIKFEKDERTNR